MTKLHKFGTFSGVFTPSILTILGVIMYMRLPMIVGQAGLWVTIGIILLAHFISVTTGLSISSLATDKKVEAGGTYYMISRSLGLPIGGTLGLALFVGLSLSISLYLIGFSESFLSYLGYEVTINSIRIAGSTALLAVTAITIISTSLAMKAQYVIMATIVLSLISIFIGNHEFAPSDSQIVGTTSGNLIPFMVLFGIFFPAVTGFEAGVSMSGDLKDPKSSIPAGSISAIVTGLVVYLGLAVFFSLTVNSDMLATDPKVLQKISWHPGLVMAGIWGATISSALGSILGAPRILQATAVDKISPRFFARGVGVSNEPRNALILTFLIAEAGILIGDLNAIARLVSIFFITTYGFINLSCAFETWTSADFRPTFKTSGWISLLGAVACFIVMIELDFTATLAAFLILGSLYLFLKRKELSLQSGDAWSGVWSSLAKTSLFKLTGAKEHTRNWRPNILMFNGADKARPFMLDLGNAISGKLGMLSSFELVQADTAKLTRLERHKESSEADKKIFHHTYLCADIYSGIDEIIRVFGFPGVEPNTVLMGWTNKKENKEKFIALMDRIQKYNFNSLFLYHANVRELQPYPSIDIWWSGRGNNLSLALNILGHLTSSEAWTKSSIRICTILSNPDDKNKLERFMRTILSESRTNATVKIIDNYLTPQIEQDIIGQESGATDLTIIGMQDSVDGSLEMTFRNVENICKRLESALFIHASDAFEEHNVIGSVTSVTAQKSTEWVLPELEQSKYSEINSDLEKIDTHGKELVLALFNKVLKPTFDLDDEVYDKLISITQRAGDRLRRVADRDTFRQRLEIEKIRKQFFSELTKFLDDSLSRSIEGRAGSIHGGMLWYLQQIAADVNRFPKSKYICHDKSEFALSESDRFAMRWLKIKERILHPWSGKEIPLKITFREGASYFFRDTRYHFLTLIMDDVTRILSASRERMDRYMSWADELFHSTIRGAEAKINVGDLASQLEERAQQQRTPHLDAKARCLQRLQVEYRKNVVFFMHQLEHLDFNRVIRKKRRTRKFYINKKIQLLNFSSEWQERAALDLNSFKTHVIIRQYYGNAHVEIDLFRSSVAGFFTDHQESLSHVAEVLSTLSMPKNGEFGQLKLPELNTDFEYLPDLVQKMSERLLQLTADIPEEVTIGVSDKNAERVLRVPLLAMIDHLVERTLSSPFEIKVESVLKEVRRITFIVTDRAKLALFNILNLKNDEPQEHRDKEVRTALQAINEELQSLRQIANTIDRDIVDHTSRLNNSLTIHELAGMSGDFSQTLRLQKTRRLQSKLSQWISGIADSVNAAFVSALYSRARGILLAKQLSSEIQSISVNERITEQAIRVTPKAGVLLDLPHYYVSLFNRRSSIGDNFWVPRPVENDELQKVYERYSASGKGMILVLGEPNEGKSTLCKHFALQKATHHVAYHIFPPEDGSIDVQVLEEVLRNATGIQGDSALLFSLLPQNSLIVFHDLELWWERSEPHGLNVIRHIKHMVEEFSERCLFVANTTPFSYAIMNTAEPLDIICAGVVRCRPFNSFELKQLIMTRHNSSGLSLDFISGIEGVSNQMRLARVFNRLFAYSNGNPGVALNAWLAGIQDYSDKMIIWKRPPLEDWRVLRDMPEVWGHFCFQLLIHNRMSVSKMSRCLQMETSDIVEITHTLKRLNLITEYTTGVYSLNSTMEVFLVAYCREKEWI